MMPDIATASAQDIENWKKETHIGSPTSIIFLTGDQRQLWGEKMLLLLADYSTGFCFYQAIVMAPPFRVLTQINRQA